MAKPDGCNLACVLLLSMAAMASAAQAQTFSLLWSFDKTNGLLPEDASLVQGIDGDLYGTTVQGGVGAGNNCCGTVFKITTAGALTQLYSFCSESNCSPGRAPSSLAQGTDGNFYGGTTYGGASGDGVVFKITPSGTLTVVHTFNATDGSDPIGLLETSKGTFYGTTEFGGAGAGGTVFKMTPNGALTALYNFCSSNPPQCADGLYPAAGLIQGSDGNFYGTTSLGGANGAGTVFKVTPTGQLTTLHSFDVTDGNEPFGPVIQATDGNFYGTTAFGGTSTNCDGGGCGTVFKLTPEGKLTTLHSFCLQTNCPDGSTPNAGLVQATDGNFYGATVYGGSKNQYGTVFRVTPDGRLTTLFKFDFFHGVWPYGGLMQDTNGSLYGTTGFGGTSDNGTVFSLDLGLGPFVSFVVGSGRVGQTTSILGQGFTGTISVFFNGAPAHFTVVSDTFIRATVPAGATTGAVTVTTPSGMLTSNTVFRITD